MVLNQGDSALWGHLAMSGIVFAIGIQARDAAKNPTVHRTALHRKELLSPQRSKVPQRENLLEGSATFS